MQVTLYPLAFDPDPRGRFVQLVPWGLRDRPRLRAELDAIGEQIATLDRALYTFMLDSSLERASGDLLRRYGLLVDVPGTGLDEPTHRRLIAGRIATTRSDGGRVGFGRAWLALTGESSRIRDAYPADVYAVATMPDYLSARVASLSGRIARAALAAGIGADLVITVEGGLILSGSEGEGLPALDGPPLAQLI